MASSEGFFARSWAGSLLILGLFGAPALVILIITFSEGV